jgi:site-specific DNA-adenine methylase
MKSIIIFAFGALIILQSLSCKKSNSNDTNSPLVNKWSQLSTRIKSSYVENGTILFSQDTTYYFTHGEYTTFNQDGTYKSGSDTTAQINSGRYSLDNNKITFISSYTLNGQLQYDTLNYDILSINTNSLIFYSSKAEFVNPGTYNSETWINLSR